MHSRISLQVVLKLVRYWSNLSRDVINQYCGAMENSACLLLRKAGHMYKNIERHYSMLLSIRQLCNFCLYLQIFKTILKLINILESVKGAVLLVSLCICINMLDGNFVIYIYV